MRKISWTIGIIIGLFMFVGLPAAALAFIPGDFVVSPTAVNLGTIRVLPGSSAGPFAFNIAIVGGPIAQVDEEAGLNETATFMAVSDSPWLSLDTTNGEVPGTITATATVSETMGSGEWTASVTILSGLDPATEPVTVTVTMNVLRSIGDLLTVSPTTLDVQMTERAALQQTFPITIANADPNKTIGYTWSAQTDVGWLDLSAFTGSSNSTITLRVDPESLFVNTDTDGDGIPDAAVGTIIFRSSLNTESVTLTVNATILPSTEHSVSPAQLYWTVEQATTTTALTFSSQKLQISGYQSGWRASCDVGFVATKLYNASGAFTNILGSVVSTDAHGWLEVTPEAALLSNMGYGNHTGYVTIYSLDRQFLRQIPITINIRKPGEEVNLPIPEVNSPSSQIEPYYSMMEATEASLINVRLPVPIDFEYYPTAETCTNAGGQWIDPDSVPGNLNEYCSLNQHAYVLLERSAMEAGTVYALTKANTLSPAYINGIKVSGADSLSYADGPVSYIPFGPLQLTGSYGTVVVSMRIGSSLTSAVEVQRLLINLQTLEGQWKVTEAYNGSYYVYDNALLNVDRVSGQSGYTSSWEGMPVSVSTGDGVTWLYRLSFSQQGINYVYEIQSLAGNQLSGRWQFGWYGGTSSWETFQAQRQLWTPLIWQP